MRTFKDYIVKEDEIAFKMKKISRKGLCHMDPAMSYYIRRMFKQQKQSPRLRMKEL